MTKAQKENIERFKKVQAEAKKLKAKNPRLAHTEAVKKAWAIFNAKGGSKKTTTTKGKGKTISGVFKMAGAGFMDVRQFDIYGNLDYVIQDKDGFNIAKITDSPKNNTLATKKLEAYIMRETGEDLDNVYKKKIKQFVGQLQKEAAEYNKGKKRTAKPAKEFVTATLAKPVAKKKAAAKPAKKAVKSTVKKQTGTTRIAIDRKIQAKKPGKRVSKSGNVYYESRANRSDKGRLLGVNKHQDTKSHNVNIKVVSGVENKKYALENYQEALKGLEQLNLRLSVFENAMKDKEFVKKMGGQSYKKRVASNKEQIKRLIKGQKNYITFLKKQL